MFFYIFSLIGSFLVIVSIFSNFPLNKKELNDNKHRIKRYSFWFIAFYIIIFQLAMLLNFFFHFIELEGFLGYFLFFLTYLFLGIYGLLYLRGYIR